MKRKGFFCKMALNMPKNSRVFLNYCITFLVELVWMSHIPRVLCDLLKKNISTWKQVEPPIKTDILEFSKLRISAIRRGSQFLTSDTSPRFKTKCTDMHRLELHWSFDYWIWLIKCWPWKTQNAICTYMTMVQKSCMDNIHIIHMKGDILSRILKQ